jgi:alpha-glucosidase (family GH31 glycosyl hydrolase)
VQLGCPYVCADAHNISDQLLFGPALLVNRVPQTGLQSRKLYLPKGSRWIDFRQLMRAHRSQSQW